MRKIISIAITLVAACCALIGLFYSLAADRGIAGTIEKSRQIDQAFQKAAAYIDGVNQKEGHLPGQDAFKKWQEANGQGTPFLAQLRLVTDHFPKAVVEEFGSPGKNAYLLSLWRGEWSEYYISWKQKTTLVMDPKAYHILGSGIKDGLFIMGISALLFILGIKTWPKLPNPLSKKNKHGK